MEKRSELALFDLRPGKSDLKKLKILESVLLSIQLNGVEGTGFESVAKHLKMTRSNVNYYFSTREEMIAAAIRIAVITQSQLIDEKLAKATEPRDKMPAFIEGNIAWAKKFPSHASGFLLFFFYSSITTRYLDIRESLIQNRVGQIETLLRQHYAKNIKHLSDAEVTELAWTLHAVVARRVLDASSVDSRHYARFVRDSKVGLLKVIHGFTAAGWSK